MIFQTNAQLLPADTDALDDIYAWQDGQFELVSVGTATAGPYTHAVDATATRVLFSTVEALSAADQSTGSDLYVRDTAAQTTTLVSRRAANPAHAYFADATADLRKVLFKTADPIDAGDTDSGHDDLYLRDLDGAATPAIVSHGGTGNHDVYGGHLSTTGALVTYTTREALLAADADTARDVYRRQVGGGLTLRSDDNAVGDANVDVSLDAVSADGARTLFSTTEALTGSEGLDGDAGRDLFEATGGVPTQLSTGPSPSTSNSTAAIDAYLVSGGAIFSTVEGLVAEDVDTNEDVYARVNGVTTLLSPGSPKPVYPQALSSDGQTVLAHTTSKMAPEDTDEQDDVYLLAAGQAPRLLTPGTADMAEAAGWTPDLSHVFVSTNAALSGADTDADLDLYDLAGSNPPALASAPAAPTAVTPTPTPPLPPVVADPAKPVKRPAPKASLRTKLVRKGHVLRVVVSCPAACKGTLTLRSAKRRGRSTVSLGSASFKLTGKGSVTVKVTVPRSSRGRLARALRGGVRATAVTRGSGLVSQTATRTLRT